MCKIVHFDWVMFLYMTFVEVSFKLSWCCWCYERRLLTMDAKFHFTAMTNARNLMVFKFQFYFLAKRFLVQSFFVCLGHEIFWGGEYIKCNVHFVKTVLWPHSDIPVHMYVTNLPKHNIVNTCHVSEHLFHDHFQNILWNIFVQIISEIVLPWLWNEAFSCM